MKIRTGALCSFLLFLVVPNAPSKVMKDSSPLRVGVTPHAPPMIFKKTNRIEGLEADFAHDFAKYLGRPLEFVEIKWKDQIPALIEGKIDIIMSGMSVTRIRSLQINFANPYLRVGQMALARGEHANDYTFIADIIMTNRRVGVELHTTGEFLVQQNFPRARKYTYPNHKKGVNALKRRRIDLLILDSPYIYWYASQNEGVLVPVPILLTEEDLAWGIRKKDTELLKAANDFLMIMEEKERKREILKKWIPYFE